MIVYDIVMIVGPETTSSYSPNSRTLIDHYDDEQIAENRCDLFNSCRSGLGFHYQVEENDEESEKRAMPTEPTFLEMK